MSDKLWIFKSLFGKSNYDFNTSELNLKNNHQDVFQYRLYKRFVKWYNSEFYFFDNKTKKIFIGIGAIALGLGWFIENYIPDQIKTFDNAKITYEMKNKYILFGKRGILKYYNENNLEDKTDDEYCKLVFKFKDDAGKDLSKHAELGTYNLSMNFGNGNVTFEDNTKAYKLETNIEIEKGVLIQGPYNGLFPSNKSVFKKDSGFMFLMEYVKNKKITKEIAEMLFR